MAGYDPNAATYPCDPKEARRLLQEMGYLKNPKTITANSFSFASLPEGPKFIEAIAGYWEAVGIKVQIRQVDATFVSKKSTAYPQGFEPPGEVGVQSPWYRPSGLNNYRVFAVSKPEIKTEVELSHPPAASAGSAVQTAQALYRSHSCRGAECAGGRPPHQQCVAGGQSDRFALPLRPALASDRLQPSAPAGDRPPGT